MTSYEESTRWCPNGDGTKAILVSRWYDEEESGMEFMDWECESGHRWTQPTRRMVIQSIGWGSLWRLRRAQIEDNRD